MTEVKSYPFDAEVQRFVLRSTEIEVELCSYGARVLAVRTRDAQGKMGNIALGADTLQPYLGEPNFYLGCATGRVANRISGGRFEIDGVAYQIEKNISPNASHGGTIGFDRRIWMGEPVENGVLFRYLSPAGEMGFPGNLQVSVQYTVVDSVLRIEYTATTDAPTIVNLTNHTYWNLAGAGDVGEHEITIFADAYTPMDESSIPTGEIATVQGTPLDLRQPTRIADGWDSDHEQIARGAGYDHNFVLRGGDELKPAAKLFDRGSGRVMLVSTTEPGLQFYSGNYLAKDFVGRGGPLTRRCGLALETQHFPDAPNHPSFPSILLRPAQCFHSVTEHEFSAKV